MWIKIRNYVMKFLGQKPIRVVIVEDGFFHLTTNAYERLVELGCTIHRCDDHPGELIKNNPDIVQYSKHKCNDNDRYMLDVGFSRADKRLLQVIEELGEKAADGECKLKIVTLPLNIRKFYVREYEESGEEYICEPHRIFS